MEQKQILDYPDYIIYSNGTIYSKKRQQFLKPILSNKYYHVKLFGNEAKYIPIHRLVISHFKENPNGLKYIKHLDTDRSNNDISNLEYCQFKDLMDKTKVRAKGKKRTYVVPYADKIEAYKHYFQFIDTKLFPSYLTIMRYRVEAEIISKRWATKRNFNAYETAFKMYCSGIKQKEILKAMNWGTRTYNKAFNTVRLQLIKDIMQEVQQGELIYNPAPKRVTLSDKKSLKIWDNFKEQFQ